MHCPLQFSCPLGHAQRLFVQTRPPPQFASMTHCAQMFGVVLQCPFWPEHWASPVHWTQVPVLPPVALHTAGLVHCAVLVHDV
jgi:hypothetical protein